MSNSTKLKVMGVLVTSQLLFGAGCNSTDFGSTNSVNTASSTSNASGLASSTKLSVYNKGVSSGQAIYSDLSGAGQTLSLTAGVQYNFHIDSSNLPNGASINLQMQDIDIVSGPKTNFALAVGDNLVTAPGGGDWSFVLQINSGSTALTSKSYQANVSCTNSSFTSASLTAANITVAAGSATNLYNFSAANVVTTNNGQAPYLCAFDLTGVGIASTQFAPCATQLTDMYVNLVGDREVGVIVKDACNKTGHVSVGAPGKNLAYTVPSGGASNPYIYGQVTNGSGNGNDVRVGGANYLATNAGGNNYVQSNTGGGDAVTSFDLVSTFNFGSLANGQPSSVPYGMSINIGNIGGTFNLKTNSGGTMTFGGSSLSATYSTDQAGDQSPQISMQSSSCTLTNPQYKVIPTTPTPCTNADGSLGTSYQATVEIWGNYTCNMTDSGGAATITGSFDGVHQMLDGCVGGGQGGGGTPPVSF